MIAFHVCPFFDKVRDYEFCVRGDCEFYVRGDCEFYVQGDYEFCARGDCVGHCDFGGLVQRGCVIYVPMDYGFCMVADFASELRVALEVCEVD